MSRRVVISGMGGITAMGEDWPTIRGRMAEGRTAVKRMAEWDRFENLNTKLAAPVEGFDVEDRYERRKLRTMGRVARLAVYATERALADAKLLNNPVLKNGRAGIAYGSSFGSHDAVMGFAEMVTTGRSRNLTSTSYVQMMSHTACVNIGLCFGLTGRIVPTSSACTSGSQAVGYGYEMIRAGIQDIIIAGGAEELSASDAVVFDTIYATSTRNDQPQSTPRPFDKARDGLVIGEGAASLILEEHEHALARGATIYAEVVGYGTNSDGNHITQPAAETMAIALRLALEDAGLDAGAIELVNGHGTATEWGDIAESIATATVLGNKVPMHSLKSYFGHSLGACGSIEGWLGIEMMRDKWFAPTANLEIVDERCAPLDYIMGSPRYLDIAYFMSNNFAFGGINTSLIFRRI